MHGIAPTLGKGSRLAPLAYASDSQLTVAFDLWHKLLGEL
jgi:hypothetical protein